MTSRWREGVRLGLAGFFITKATLSSELIHVEKGGDTVTFSSRYLTLQLTKCFFSVSSYSCGKPAGRDCHPILQKGKLRPPEEHRFAPGHTMSEAQWKADPYPLAPQPWGSKRLWSMAASRTQDRQSDLHFAWGILFIAKVATFGSEWPGFGTVAGVLFGVLGKMAQMREFVRALYDLELGSRGIRSRWQGRGGPLPAPSPEEGRSLRQP